MIMNCRCNSDKEENVMQEQTVVHQVKFYTCAEYMNGFVEKIQIVECKLVTKITEILLFNY
jgi:hypothetical protein